MSEQARDRRRTPCCRTVRDLGRVGVWTLILALVLVAAPPGTGLAQGADTRIRDARILTQDFLRHHPDIKHRLEGLTHLDAGEPAKAAREFRRAAHYADKVSQAALAELIWEGALPGRSRSEAYAWMDLAAERGYPVFVAKREQYWAGLAAAEREAAIKVGVEIYSQYGDDVAKPRLAEMLRRGRVAVTGSRVGYVGQLQVLIPGPGGNLISISGDEYYQDRLWRPEEYFAWQDQTWGVPPTGTVTVGELATQASDDKGHRQSVETASEERGDDPE